MLKNLFGEYFIHVNKSNISINFQYCLTHRHFQLSFIGKYIYPRNELKIVDYLPF